MGLDAFLGKFAVLCEINNELYILHKGNNVVILYVRTFRFICGSSYGECEKYNLFMGSKSEFKTIAEKLRFYRLNNSISQSELAKIIGIDRLTYIEYEKGLKYYPHSIMQKIADVYNMPIDKLLDDYHEFAYGNQGELIKGIRQKCGLNQYDFAKAIDVSKSTIQKAEQNRGGFSEKSYRKLMKFCKSNRIELRCGNDTSESVYDSRRLLIL